MGDETWTSIQLVKKTRESLRDRMKKRKAERENILNEASASSTSASTSTRNTASVITSVTPTVTDLPKGSQIEDQSKIEYTLLELLKEGLMPIHSDEVVQNLSSKMNQKITNSQIINLLQKFAYKELISIKQQMKDGVNSVNITSLENSKVMAVLQDNKNHRDDKDLVYSILNTGDASNSSNKVKDTNEPPNKILCTDDKDVKCKEEDDVMSLLSVQSIRERETKKVGEEIMELLSKPTTKEKSLAQRFRSQGGAKVQEFCPHGTKEECEKQQNNKTHKCGKLHFKKIIQKHTDESLGDCSFLNTCFHMDSCRYVHYEVDYSGLLDQQDTHQVISQNKQLPIITNATPVPSQSDDNRQPNGQDKLVSKSALASHLMNPIGRARMDDRTVLFPSQWIQCDLRFLDMSILGKFAVIMADPPWDIHMELPYGTMSDDEMRQLNVPIVQDEGLIFLWVTGRAMELGRECLLLWGYERVDEIIWVKTNQLQRIIRTGRTGHWLNHGKEHCLVGMKGNPKINKWLDCDVIVAEVRATSHKPDEIYGIIERLSPGTRKLELFGRPHNVQPNWLTLGNQLEGINLLEDDLVKGFKEHYPDGICRKPS